MFSWIDAAEVNFSRVYALAFTADHKLLLSGEGLGDPQYQLPG
jgi:hypothetical protein